MNTQNTYIDSASCGFTKGLMQFLDESPVALLAADNIGKRLRAAGYRPLAECDFWNLQPGDRFYVTRGGTAVIACRIPEGCRPGTGYHITASHLDSPCFRIKSNAEIVVEQQYVTLNVEKYGGMILSTWLDRPLSVAGRVLVRTKKGIESRLLNIDRDLLIIPSVAIHMNRAVNDGYKWDMRQDLRPLLTGAAAERADSWQAAADSDAGSDGCAVRNLASNQNDRSSQLSHAFRSLIAKEAGVLEDDIIDTDLYLYNREKATLTGLHGEFLSSGRLDDLQCAYASLEGFLSAASEDSAIAVYCALDNEEVGSMTKQGADSSFLRDTLERISDGLGYTKEDLRRGIASSFMISADNAHAVHPNHPELEDPTHRPVLNGGIVIKYSANQKYTTDAVSGAVMKELCRTAGVPFQIFYNRSDLLGGSTLGNISGTQLSLNTVDIGLPQLAMHSAYETAGTKDAQDLANVCRIFYEGSMHAGQSGSYETNFCAE